MVKDLGRAFQCDSPGSSQPDNFEADSYPLFFLKYFLRTQPLAPIENINKALISPHFYISAWSVLESFYDKQKSEMLFLQNSFPLMYTPFITP